MNSPSTFPRRSAIAGAVVWALLLLTVTADFAPIDLIHKVVLFAVFVIVPAGLSLIAPDHRLGNLFLYKIVVVVQPIAAIATAASFFFEKGAVSALLASPWLILDSLIALFGLTRLTSRRGFSPVAELSIDAGLLYLPVAGVWLVIYRLGIQPFDYGETIILLTAVHFHFTGFATPIIAGMSGRVLAAREHGDKIFILVVFGTVAAMPLVAAGITFTPLLGLIGTLLLSTALILLAVLNIIWVRPAIDSALSRTLLIVGAVSSCTAMVLASLYSYSLVAHTVILTIPGMAVTHGLLNAFGFVTCSFLAWIIMGHKTAPKKFS
jgi:YndJ-like protein